ncbi:MAG: methyltransferase domain-containing protein [Planctomycetota bacterium]
MPRPDGRRPGPKRRPGPGAARGGPAFRPRPAPAPKGPPVEIVFKDEDLLAAVKPAGVPVGRRSGTKSSFIDRLVVQLRRGRPGPAPFVVTPLDKEASGLLLVARTSDAVRAADTRLRDRRARRGYLALVEGELPVGENRTIQGFQLINRRGVAQSVKPEEHVGENPQRAVTHLRVEASGSGVSLVRVRAETDLPMQVRCHLSEAGHPIVGDRAYGGVRTPQGLFGLFADEIHLPAGDGADAISARLPRPEWMVRALEAGVGVLGAIEGAEVVRTSEGEEQLIRFEEEVASASDEEPAADRGWDHVAGWYAELLGSGSSDLHDEVVHPGVMRLLDLMAGERVLDLACGEGTLARLLARSGAEVAGVDASPALIEIARERTPEHVAFRAHDARDLPSLELGAFDAVACVLALMNIDPIVPVFEGIAGALHPGGRAVIVLLHPAFRSPRRTSWGWVEQDDRTTQFRRVDAYMSEEAVVVTMNPGAAASGDAVVETTTHHRPIGAYVAAAAGAGLTIDAMEEWVSHRRSEAGPRAAEEDRARREFPVFLTMRLRRT